MKSIPTCPQPDKVILIHHGALGDFLNVWPGALAVSRAFPNRSLYWAGAGDRLHWLEPLGYSPCPAPLRRGLDRLYGADAWPQELEGFLALWFVLDRVPNVPASGDCRFLRAIPESKAVHAPSHVRDAYAQELASLGIPAVSGWLDDFRRLFAAKRSPGRRVLLFPGAGHPGKQWPLVQYFQLADMIRARGLEPLFVLGPAELDRGLIPEDRAFAAPDDLHALSRLILAAKAVVGPDTGPMHLAGMLGVPGVSLFGPTDSGIWGPVGMREVSLGLGCSPCTTTCADLDCPEQRCIWDIPAGRVMMELDEAVAKSETGFQDPGFLESRLWQKEEERNK